MLLNHQATSDGRRECRGLNRIVQHDKRETREWKRAFTTYHSSSGKPYRGILRYIHVQYQPNNEGVPFHHLRFKARMHSSRLPSPRTEQHRDVRIAGMSWLLFVHHIQAHISSFKEKGCEQKLPSLDPSKKDPCTVAEAVIRYKNNAFARGGKTRKDQNPTRPKKHHEKQVRKKQERHPGELLQ